MEELGRGNRWGSDPIRPTGARGGGGRSGGCPPPPHPPLDPLGKDSSWGTGGHSRGQNLMKKIYECKIHLVCLKKSRPGSQLWEEAQRHKAEGVEFLREYVCQKSGTKSGTEI